MKKKAQQNPFGRKRDEAPGIEEMMASLNENKIPWNDEAEKSVISAILQDPVVRVEDCRNNVPLEAFYSEANRIVYTYIVRQYDAGLPIDPVLITTSLREGGMLERVGGPATITELFSFIPVPSHYAFYKKLVMSNYRRRLVIQTCLTGIAETIQEENHLEESHDAIPGIKEDLDLIEEAHKSVEYKDKTVKGLITDLVEEITYAQEHPGQLRGVTTGFLKIDKECHGFYGSRMWIIKAPTSQGKSTLSRQLIESVCKTTVAGQEYNHAGVIYTYETDPKNETANIIASIGSIDKNTMKTGKMNRRELEAFQKAAKEIAGWSIDIIPVAERTLEWIIRDIKKRRRKLKEGQRLVVEIDYVQLIQTEAKTKGGESRQQQIAKITQKIKRTTQSTGVDIILPSQVNDDGDTREADDIQNDADVILDILDDAPPKKKTGYEARNQTTEEDDGMRKKRIKCTKNRDGDIGWSIKANLKGAFARFDEAY